MRNIIAYILLALPLLAGAQNPRAAWWRAVSATQVPFSPDSLPSLALRGSTLNQGY
jgi:hypothetical protein